MPTGFVPAAGTYQGTWVWGYKDVNGQTATSYIGPVILATRGTPTTVTYINNLGSMPTNVQAWDTSTDRTLHWADPPGQGHQMTNYTGPSRSCQATGNVRAGLEGHCDHVPG
ncbi:MAG: hypothetical protein K0A89_00540 [ANME-2 cluster archaeon]|nr:hypothetical protein [ANME-2 cluster archaeon]